MANSLIIPRDALVDCRPWEPANLGHGAGHADAESGSAPPISEAEWQAALDAALAEARDEGHRDGFAQGFQNGFEQGRRQGEEDAKRIAALMQTMHEAVTHLNGVIAEELVDLALQLAQQILRGALRAQPERVLPLIREVLGDEPTARVPTALRVHADDAELIRQALGSELDAANWTLVNDAAIERGGCRIQTRFGQTDATLQTRWAELTRTLGHDTAWIVNEPVEDEPIAQGVPDAS